MMIIIINFLLQLLIPKQASNMCLTLSSSKQKGHLPLSAFLLKTFPIYDLLLQLKFISLRSVNSSLAFFAKILSLLIPLYPSFTIFATSLKLCSCSFIHTNVNPVCTVPVSTTQSNFSHSYYSCVIHDTVLPYLVYPNTQSDTSILLLRALASSTLCQVPFQHIKWLHY